MIVRGSGSARLANYRWVKRAIDLTFLIGTAPVTLPVGLATALLVGTCVGRPVLYRQLRMGRDEKVFTILKFRTMTNQKDVQGVLLPDEQRLTKIGRALRKSSLDEIPQLINIAKGEMTLVGPRPLYPRYRPFYTQQENIRHSVRPGITGRAQVSGRNALLWHERLRHDVAYVEQLSICQDASILWRTFLRVVHSSDVSVVAGDSGEPLDIARGYPQVDGLTMRRLEVADVPFRVRWMNDERTRQYMSLPPEVSIEGTKEWLRRARNTVGRYDFTVTDVRSGLPLAMVGLTPREGDGAPELYVFVDPSRQGQGLGSATMKIVLEWLKRSDSPYQSCWLTVDVENERAIRIYKRLGFHVVGANTARRIRMDWGSTK